MKKKTTDQLLSEAFKNPKYNSKHVIIIGGKVYATKTGAAASELLEKLLKKFPNEVPNISYIPGGETLIGIFGKRRYSSTFGKTRLFGYF